MRAPEHVRTVTPMTTDTIDDTRTNDVESSDSVLDKIRAMAPAIAARGDEIEQGRRLPTDLVEKLSTAGCFRAMVPASHGGERADLRRAAARDQGTGTSGRLGRLDGDDRQFGVCCARAAATVLVRPDLRQRT
jgi:alkylation response protein AidB-like acyl-CoA dehydrogenase